MFSCVNNNKSLNFNISQNWSGVPFREEPLAEKNDDNPYRTMVIISSATENITSNLDCKFNNNSLQEFISGSTYQKTNQEGKEPYKIRLTNAGERLEIPVQKFASGHYKKIILAKLYNPNTCSVTDVAFAKFNSSENKRLSLIERESYILQKIKANLPEGCRGLATIVGISKWLSRDLFPKTGFIFPFFNGGTLKEAKKMTTAEVIRISLDLCWGLKSLHDLGIFHHDIKAENVCLTRNLSTKEICQAHLIDFGIATEQNHPLHQAVLSINKAVASPELKKAYKNAKNEKNLSSKSDIYSLGKLFKEHLPVLSTNQCLAELLINSQNIHPQDRPSIDDLIRELEKFQQSMMELE